MTTHTHQTAPTQFVEANGIRFAYRRFGKTGGLVEPRFGVARMIRSQIGIDQEGARTARKSSVITAFEKAHSSSAGSVDPRSTGLSGWIVEIACL